MSINMYCGSQYDYKQGVVHELIKSEIIDFCLTDFIPDNVNFPVKNDKIVEVDHGPSITSRYEEICDMTKIPALGKELMEEMLPYESMAIKLDMKVTGYLIADYEEAKRHYYLHLRYWNYMFEKYNINFVFLRCSPHAQGKYVVYALAKIKNIPILIYDDCSIPTRCVYGSSIEKVGSAIGDFFENNKGMDIEKIELDGVVKDFYENRINRLAKINNSFKDKGKIHERNLNCRGSHTGWNEKDILFKFLREYIYSIWHSLGNTHSLSLHKKRKSYLRTVYRNEKALNVYKKHLSYNIKDYTRMSNEPNYDEKYIYFAIQHTPEVSTVPRAGVFAEQYNSIQLLARAAEKNGIKVYVKEHYVQDIRSKDFYEDLLKIENVVFIKPTISTYDLIRHSIAVSTQQGTCILEGILMNRPALVFGDGYYWKKMPGIYEIHNEIDGGIIIRNVMDGKITISQSDVKRYFYAIQCKTISTYNQKEMEDYLYRNMISENNASMDEKIKLISTFIRNIEEV